MTDEKNLKPFLKWAGGKRQLLNEINECLPKNFNTFYDIFVGGGSVFLNLQKENVVINDYNSELINTYLVVKNNLEELIEQLENHKLNNSSEYYYAVRCLDRTEDFKNLSNVERASRFIYMNKTGYNGLYRVNKKNQSNVPFGKYKNPKVFNVDDLGAVSKYLNEKNVVLRNLDFAEAVADAQENDFIYLDPPYASLDSSSNFTAYTEKDFNNAEQERLRDLFVELDKKGCFVMMSNSSTSLIHELYKDYANTTKIVKASRMINSNALKRGKIDEVLIMNYKT